MEDRALPEHIAHAITNRGLKLILNPTEQCNLRCTYCYETFSVKQMPQEVVRGVLRFIQRRAALGLDWLEIEFFGGEPLAAWRVVDALSAGINSTCDNHNVALLGAMTTNATLLDEDRLGKLAERHFTSYQITLDGSKSLHDSRRVTRSGRGTFDVILRRLQMISQSPHPLEVMLRVHFDRCTVNSLIQPGGLIDQLATAFINPDRRFSLHFNPLEPWGPASQSPIPFFSDAGMMNDALRRLLAHAEHVGIPPNQLPQSQAVSPTGESGHVVCYAARSNSFLVRADGRLGKCTVALDCDENTIGRILPNGELEIDHDRHLPWLRGLVSGEPRALRCPAMGFVW